MAKKFMGLWVSFIVLFILLSGCTSGPATRSREPDPSPAPAPAVTQVQYHRVYADTLGESHFDTLTVNRSLVSAAPPAPPFYVSALENASRYRFYSFQPGWYGDLHPAPARQFLALLSGTVEVETSDGTVRAFGPGDLILLEDTAGKGHRSRNTGSGYLNFFVVQVPVT
jgi:hypothetical protein